MILIPIAIGIAQCQTGASVKMMLKTKHIRLKKSQSPIFNVTKRHFLVDSPANILKIQYYSINFAC